MANHKSQNAFSDYVKLFGDYLKAFGQDWLTLMSGPLAVPFAILASFFSGWGRALLLLLAAACIIFASFRVWRTQQGEIARLRVRPYDEEQQRLVSVRLTRLGADERDLLRYFVQFGEREQQRIYADAGIEANDFGRILTQVSGTGLLERQERPKSGRAGTDLFWWVNLQFIEVLKDALFPRQEDVPQRVFLP